MKVRKTLTHFVADCRPHGGQHKFPLTPAGERGAKRYLRGVENDLERRGSYIDPSRSPLFVDAVAAYLTFEKSRADLGELTHCHVDNKRVALEHIGQFGYQSKTMNQTKLTDLRPGAIRTEIIPALFGGRWAHDTASKKYIIFRHFLAYCVEIAETLNTIPAPKSIPKPPPKKPTTGDLLSPELINRIIDVAPDAYRLAIKFAASTGLRAGELRALSWSEADSAERGLDLDAGLVYVTRAVKKSGKIGDPKTAAGTRAIPLAPSLLAEMREWKLRQPLLQRRNNLVFPNRDGDLNDINNMRNRGLHKACDNAGLPRIKWNDLRHYFASLLLYHTTESDATITQLIGHQSVSFTRTQYGHWMESARRDEELAARLDTALTKG